MDVLDVDHDGILLRGDRSAEQTEAAMHAGESLTLEEILAEAEQVAPTG